jgi:hypothetical protein
VISWQCCIKISFRFCNPFKNYRKSFYFSQQRSKRIWKQKALTHCMIIYTFCYTLRKMNQNGVGLQGTKSIIL